MIEALLKLPLPPTLNDQVRDARSNRFQSAKVKRKWTDIVACCAKGLDTPQFPGKVWVAFTWQVRNFARDSDNIAASAKFIFDGLVASGVLTKDSLMVVQSPVIHHYERGQDEVIVEIADQPIYEVRRVPA